MTIFINIVPNTHYAPYTLRITLSETPSLEVKTSTFFVARRPATKKSLFSLEVLFSLAVAVRDEEFFGRRKNSSAEKLALQKRSFFVARRFTTKKECLFSYSLANLLKNPCFARRLGTRNFKNTDQNIFVRCQKH